MAADGAAAPRALTVAEAMRRAWGAYRASEDGEVERLCTLVLRAVPDHPGARRLLGIMRVRQKRNAEALACLEPLAAQQPRDFEVLYALGKALRGLGRSQEALEHLERALAVLPGQPFALCQRAIALLELDRLEEAKAGFEQALAARPEYPEALNGLGATLIELRRYAEAERSYRAALALRPGYPDALSNTADALMKMQRHAEALELTERAVAAAPRMWEAWNIRGLLLTALNRLAEADACYEQALALRPGSPEVEVNQGLCRMRMGDFATGLLRLESRWKQKAFQKIKRDLAQPRWRGEAPIRGKTLLLHAEQGYGDTIQFARFVATVASQGARVVLEVQRALARLMQGLDSAAQVVARGDPLPAFEVHDYLLSVPHALGTTRETLPAPRAYLRAKAADLAKWEQRLGARRGFRVALAWAGNSRHRRHFDERAVPTQRLAPLLAVPGVEWLSVQKDVPPEDLAALERTAQLRSVAEELEDFADTAAVLELCDLVVSVDTSIAHLAGALGRPGWVMAPFNADWRWMPAQEQSIWYPSLRVVRQPAPADWGPVLERAAAEVAAARG